MCPLTILARVLMMEVWPIVGLQIGVLTARKTCCVSHSEYLWRVFLSVYARLMA